MLDMLNEELPTPNEPSLWWGAAGVVLLALIVPTALAQRSVEVQADRNGTEGRVRVETPAHPGLPAGANQPFRTAHPPSTESFSRSAALRPLKASPPPPEMGPSNLGDALIGSSIGAAIGIPLGVALVAAAQHDASWEGERCNRPSESGCGLQRLGIGLAGVAVAVGGPVAGAVQRLNAGGVGVVAPSVAGELLVGGLGYVFGRALAGPSARRVGGIALGIPLAAFGAAAGAVLGAREVRSSPSGGVRLQKGQWSLGVPDVRVRPGIRSGGTPFVQVTLFSAGF